VTALASYPGPIAVDIQPSGEYDAMADMFAVVHALAVRGTMAELPAGVGHLVDAGLIEPTAAGFCLTEGGYRVHRALAEQEREALDLPSLAVLCGRLPVLTRRLAALAAECAGQTDPRERCRSAHALAATIDVVAEVVARGARAAPRFGEYLPRLRAVAAALRSEPAVAAYASSAAALGRELREDYLQTLGQGIEREDL
jgi:hypothetical protein